MQQRLLGTAANLDPRLLVAFITSHTARPAAGTSRGLAKRVIACLDVRANDAGDLVVTKGDQYDVRDKGTAANDVRNLGLPVQLAGRYFVEGADEVTFLNITGFRDFPLGDLPMLEVSIVQSACANCVKIGTMYGAP